MTGDVCLECGNRGRAITLALVLVVAIMGILTFLAFKPPSGRRSKASIVLRLAMTHLQAVGTLKGFLAGGTALYRSAMGWTDAVSSNPLSAGSLSCLMDIPFLLRYILIIALPVLVSLAVILTFLVGTVATHTRCRAGLQLLDCAGVTQSLRKWWRERRHQSTIVLVLFLAYMAVVANSLKALDCMDEVIDGTRYLREDRRVACHVGQHSVAVAIAFAALIFIGIGFPVGLLLILTAAGDHIDDPSFRLTYGFLFIGFSEAKFKASMCARRVSASLDGRHLQWLRRTWDMVTTRVVYFESVGLLRRAGIVCLATLVTNPYLQSAGACLWLTLFLIIQLHVQPYLDWRFNALESMCLIAAVATASISSVLLQFDVTGPTFKSQAAAAMGATEWGVTIALLIVNISVIAILAGFWVFFQFVDKETPLSSRLPRLLLPNRWRRDGRCAIPMSVKKLTLKTPVDGAEAEVAHKQSRPFQQAAVLRAERVGPAQSTLLAGGVHTCGSESIRFEPQVVASARSHDRRSRNIVAMPPTPFVGGMEDGGQQTTLSIDNPLLALGRADSSTSKATKQSPAVPAAAGDLA